LVPELDEDGTPAGDDVGAAQGSIASVTRMFRRFIRPDDVTE
jgi:hypothetical protein